MGDDADGKQRGARVEMENMRSVLYIKPSERYEERWDQREGERGDDDNQKRTDYVRQMSCLLPGL